MVEENALNEPGNALTDALNMQHTTPLILCLYAQAGMAHHDRCTLPVINDPISALEPRLTQWPPLSVGNMGGLSEVDSLFDKQFHAPHRFPSVPQLPDGFVQILRAGARRTRAPAQGPKARTRVV
jgi:hypothetical protein